MGSTSVVWSVKAHTDQVSSIAFFPGGKQVVSGSWDSRIHIADAKTGRTTSAFRAHRKSINEVAVSPDGKHLASCCTQGVLHVWDVETQKTLASEKTGLESATLTFTKDTVILAEGTRLRFFDVPTKKMRHLRSVVS